MMQGDGLITGLQFHKPWQATWILLNDYEDAEITSAGITYLTENSIMAKVKAALLESVDMIAGLIGLVGLK